MKPNYSGRLLDRLVLIAFKQTASVRENPDDPEYAAVRGGIVETVTWAVWEARERLQRRRRENLKK